MQEKLIEELRECLRDGSNDPTSPEHWRTWLDKILSRAEQEAKEEPLDKISTPDLIAELERRRPCPQNNCANNGDCTYCVWANGTMKDNFKEAK